MLQNFLCMFMNKPSDPRVQTLRKDDKDLLIEGYLRYQKLRFTAKKYVVIAAVTCAALFVQVKVWNILNPASPTQYVMRYPISEEERLEQKRQWIDDAVALAQKLGRADDMQVAQFLQHNVYGATVYARGGQELQIQPIEKVPSPVAVAFLSVKEQDEIMIPFYEARYISPMNAILVRERFEVSSLWKSISLLKEGKKILYRRQYGVDPYEEMILEEYSYHILQGAFPKSYREYVQKEAESFRFQIYHNERGQEGVQIDFQQNEEVEKAVLALVEDDIAKEYMASFIKHAAMYAVEQQLSSGSSSIKNHAKKTAFTRIDQLF